MTKTASASKRLLCILLTLVLLLPPGVKAAGENAFTLPDPLPPIEFQDVVETAWYYDYVRMACALELMLGIGKATFSPNGQVALSQGITVAVRVYESYHGIEDASGGYVGPWYAYYVERAKAYDILPDPLKQADVNRSATRAELAALLSRALPEEELQPINPVAALHDYEDTDLYWESVIALFQAGVLTGNAPGQFNPNRNIRRSELAAVLVRLVLPEYRVRMTEENAVGMNAFALPQQLPTLTFTDVSSTHWFYPYVRQAYALELVSGVSQNRFDPNGTVRLGQAVTVAVRIYEKYYGAADGSSDYGGAWYSYYMDRARTYGILPSELADMSAEQIVTRAELAAILHGALPKAELKPQKEIQALPDYDGSDLYWSQVQALYQAGILMGQDSNGTFRPGSFVRRSELATLLTRLVQPDQRNTEPLVLDPAMKIQTIQYGTSGQGRPLMAYRFGNGKNVMVLTFAIHGWEDSFPRDGQLLVHTGNALRSELAARYGSLVKAGDWTVYVLPCLNPDGLYAGWTHNGPGRCTVVSIDADGNRRDRGIDLNRSFPLRYSRAYGDRNYNGTAPLQAAEAQALAKFTREVMGQSRNILIDTHGWYQQTVVMSGTSNPLYQAFHTYFPRNTHTYFGDCNGYYSAWAGHELGYEACLFEFPEVSGMMEFYNNGFDTKFIAAISDLLRSGTAG